MPGDVDALIDELFPEQRPVAVAPPAPSKVPSDWDSPPKSAGGPQTSLPTRVSSSPPPIHRQHPVEAAAVSPSSRNVLYASDPAPSKALRSSFDEDSGDDAPHPPSSGTSSAPPTYDTTNATNALAGHTVPFPVVHEGLCAACHQSCTVAAAPNESLYHPSVADIRTLHTLDPMTPRSTVMKRKGALHVCYPDPAVGNGVGEGGCVHITCRRCDHPVVRLQGAAWDDHNGQLDLYLALRNYYPDWSRLASLVSAGGSRSPLLVADSASAAYCCQCSWLTAHGPSPIVFPTTAMDIVTFNRAVEKDHRKVHCAFLTHLPPLIIDAASEGKRPPLWECKGHNAF